MTSLDIRFEKPDGPTRLLRIVLILLLTVSVFDPADLIFHAKAPLFALAWAIILVDLIIGINRSWPVNYVLWLYVTLFALVLPMTSIALYFLRGGTWDVYDGFVYLKAYLFVSLAIPLAIKRIDLIRPLRAILTVLSLVTVILYVAVLTNPDLRLLLAGAGDASGVFALTERTYGSFSYQLVYFHTSPLLVLPLAYFAYRCIHTKGKARIFYALAVLLNSTAMFMSGTRNNIVSSILAPLAVIFWYSRHKLRVIALTITGMGVLLAYKFDVIAAMISSEESDNALKLAHARDYMGLFHEWPILLFGQGLGARFNSTLYGYTSITELTYFDLLRSYGLIGAAVVLIFLLYPLMGLYDPRHRDTHYLYIAYAIHLILCVSNPLLFSSSGMLLLALVICDRWREPQRVALRQLKLRGAI